MSQNKPKAIIIDCEGLELTDEEKRLFNEQNPYGFILFKRNCDTPDQVKKLVKQMRDAVGRPDAPVLIDQEGGSVSRLKEPAFKEFPSAGFFKKIAEKDLEKAKHAVYLNALMMAEQLRDLGITVNCTPVVDVAVKESHEFLAGSRVYGDDASQVTELGKAVCAAHLDMGVMPILKHIPGHGRATSDSHLDLPKIKASLDDLKKQDFKPFADIANEGWGQSIWAMTAHVVYSQIIDGVAGTLSPEIIQDIIRKQIGFDGVLIADDISMKALKGDLADLAKQTLAAGCDLTLLCNQNFATREAVLKATPAITGEAEKRLDRAEKTRQMTKKQVDIKSLAKEYQAILDEANIADERECNQNRSDPTDPVHRRRGSDARKKA